VEGLSPSHDYQFRVIAENFYGRSDPCEPTSLIQTVTEQEGRRKKGLGDTDGQSHTPHCTKVNPLMHKVAKMVT